MLYSVVSLNEDFLCSFCLPSNTDWLLGCAQPWGGDRQRKTSKSQVEKYLVSLSLYSKTDMHVDKIKTSLLLFYCINLVRVHELYTHYLCVCICVCMCRHVCV